MASIRQTGLNKIVITSTGNITLRKEGTNSKTTGNQIRVLSNVILSPSRTKRNYFGDNTIQSSAEEVELTGEVKPEQAVEHITLDHSYAFPPHTYTKPTITHKVSPH